MNRTTLHCQGCGAVLELDPGRRTVTCAFCGSPQVVERPPAPGREAPTFALGFVVERPRALELARAWKGSRGLFAPRRFNAAPAEEVQGVYAPAYLYTAEAHAEYHAEIGEHYQVRVKGKDGKERTETRTEWKPLTGRWAGYVEDVVVTASRGIANEDLERIEPFDLRALRRYTPKLVAGWIAEEPSLDRATCQELGRREALTEVHRRLSAFMPGDRHRNLRPKVSLMHEDLELLLLPVWVLPVRYHPEKPPARLLVNGQTGAVYGRVPVSGWKVLVAVVTVLAIAAALYVLLGGGP